MHIQRRAVQKLKKALARQAAVALLGPKKVGKTSLALEIADSESSLYLDLQSRKDREKLANPRMFLEKFEDRLVILDEIHRTPEIFQELRGIIDHGRRSGKGIGRFLILGSASMNVLKQTGESLAGRIEFVDLNPVDVSECSSKSKEVQDLWIRGGFPNSYLAASDEDSIEFREDFIRTYLERDVYQFGSRISVETLERLWTMLAHLQGTTLNSSKLAMNLAKSSPTVSGYVDFLVDLLLIRRLQPFATNAGKRLVKSPKVYIRDSGILHAFLGIKNYDKLMGHPIVGMSWEGFVIENLMSVAKRRTTGSFYRTSSGAEIDLILELPGLAEKWAIEIKLGKNAKPTKGFHIACNDVKPDRKFVVHSGTEEYPVAEDTTAIGLDELTQMLISSC